MLRRFLLVALCAALPACDLLEPLPDVPPPDGATHPYGEGNGKVVFLSDLAAAEQIDVTLGGEPIGTILRFTGCPSRVTTDDSLAVAIRPAGTYQYAAQSANGLSWGSTIQIDEDEVTRQVLIGRPSQYANHFPDEIEGYPASSSVRDEFILNLRQGDSYRLVVQRPTVVQGDRIDVVINGAVVARGLALGTTDPTIPLELAPGPNWFAFRLSHDPDGDGTSARFRFELGTGGTAFVYAPIPTAWGGANVRYAC